MRVNDREQLHGGELRVVRLAVHEALDHLDDLLSQILHVHFREDVFDRFYRLRGLVFSLDLPSRAQRSLLLH